LRPTVAAVELSLELFDLCAYALQQRGRPVDAARQVVELLAAL
jgi:hypothetical protein